MLAFLGHAVSFWLLGYGIGRRKAWPIVWFFALAIAEGARFLITRLG